MPDPRRRHEEEEGGGGDELFPAPTYQPPPPPSPDDSFIHAGTQRARQARLSAPNTPAFASICQTSSQQHSFERHDNSGKGHRGPGNRHRLLVQGGGGARVTVALTLPRRSLRQPISELHEPHHPPKHRRKRTQGGTSEAEIPARNGGRLGAAPRQVGQVFMLRPSTLPPPPSTHPPPRHAPHPSLQPSPHATPLPTPHPARRTPRPFLPHCTDTPTHALPRPAPPNVRSLIYRRVTPQPEPSQPVTSSSIQHLTQTHC
ncbi:protein TRACHEARY ELEMENT DIFFERENTIATION-RELATED 7A-like [Portunus trituberculatus]|uniref:protein TRACHEARY ELEMENT DIFFERENTIATION-RELATED 7A-like n=1 Tax=Portunus trituberculatus TaxID=210409 RepID=UPI001E1D1ACD|nr:protein TRACHEARY ELEMENT DIFFERENTIATION-RELATED 7A-like [Portunus trituberculatus]